LRKKTNLTVFDGGPILNPQLNTYGNTLGEKRYELTNHLGNVMVIITDRKMWNATDQVYEAVTETKADYFTGGMIMHGEKRLRDWNGAVAMPTVSASGRERVTVMGILDQKKMMR
jgi:hypothetical protein